MRQVEIVGAGMAEIGATCRRLIVFAAVMGLLAGCGGGGGTDASGQAVTSDPPSTQLPPGSPSGSDGAGSADQPPQSSGTPPTQNPPSDSPPAQNPPTQPIDPGKNPPIQLPPTQPTDPGKNPPIQPPTQPTDPGKNPPIQPPTQPTDPGNPGDTAPTDPVSPPATSSAVTVSWSAPSENTDGSPLTDLSGYTIYYGTQSADLSTTIRVPNPGLLTYVVEGLQSGTTYYFAVAADASSGAESDLSQIASVTPR